MNATTHRTFSFETSYDTPVPEENLNHRESPLPFRAWFTAEADKALKGEQPSIFVPKAYWVQERGADPEKMDYAAQRNRLRTQFRDWKAGLAEGSPYATLNVLLVNRNEKSPQREEGISMWMVKQS